MKLGVAVIGCGDMGTTHARAWHAREDAFVAAVYDPLTERRDGLAAETGAAACGSAEEAIGQEDVQAVSVCTPCRFHPEIALHAMEHNRHVLTEKAIALTLADADRMIAAAARRGVQLSVGYQYRAFGRNLLIKRLVEEGAFGGPLFARYADIREVRPKLAMHEVSLNGGPIIDMAGHLFDLMRFFTGAEPETVFATGHVFGRGKPRLATVTDFAVDAAEVVVRMAGGHVLSVFVNWGMPEGFPGDTDEYFAGPALAAKPAPGGLLCQRGEHSEVLAAPDVQPGGTAYRIDDLVRAIRGERPLQLTAQDARVALSVSLAALESITIGEVVSVAAR